MDQHGQILTPQSGLDDLAQEGVLEHSPAYRHRVEPVPAGQLDRGRDRRAPNGLVKAGGDDLRRLGTIDVAQDGIDGDDRIQEQPASTQPISTG